MAKNKYDVEVFLLSSNFISCFNGVLPVICLALMLNDKCRIIVVSFALLIGHCTNTTHYTHPLQKISTKYKRVLLIVLHFLCTKGTTFNDLAV